MLSKERSFFGARMVDGQLNEALFIKEQSDKAIDAELKKLGLPQDGKHRGAYKMAKNTGSDQDLKTLIKKFASSMKTKKENTTMGNGQDIRKRLGQMLGDDEAGSQPKEGTARSKLRAMLSESGEVIPTAVGPDNDIMSPEVKIAIGKIARKSDLEDDDIEDILSNDSDADVDAVTQFSEFTADQMEEAGVDEPIAAFVANGWFEAVDAAAINNWVSSLSEAEVAQIAKLNEGGPRYIKFKLKDSGRVYELENTETGEALPYDLDKGAMSRFLQELGATVSHPNSTDHTNTDYKELLREVDEDGVEILIKSNRAAELEGLFAGTSKMSTGDFDFMAARYKDGRQIVFSEDNDNEPPANNEPAEELDEDDQNNVLMAVAEVVATEGTSEEVAEVLKKESGGKEEFTTEQAEEVMQIVTDEDVIPSQTELEESDEDDDDDSTTPAPEKETLDEVGNKIIDRVLEMASDEKTSVEISNTLKEEFGVDYEATKVDEMIEEFANADDDNEGDDN